MKTGQCWVQERTTQDSIGVRRNDPGKSTGAASCLLQALKWLGLAHTCWLALCNQAISPVVLNCK